jgi:hypothetical protein
LANRFLGDIRQMAWISGLKSMVSTAFDNTEPSARDYLARRSPTEARGGLKSLMFLSVIETLVSHGFRWNVCQRNAPI